MEFEKIISVTGLPGLYELVSSRTDGVVVKSLEDQSKKFASNRKHQFSNLESIEVYTLQENVPLREVLIAMQQSDKTLPDAKATGDALRAYFAEVYPDMDFERVFNSDLKKMVKWFDILTKNNINLEPKESSEEKEEVSEEEEK